MTAESAKFWAAVIGLAVGLVAVSIGWWKSSRQSKTRKKAIDELARAHMEAVRDHVDSTNEAALVAALVRLQNATQRVNDEVNDDEHSNLADYLRDRGAGSGS